jgi:hypothetical protein
VFGIAAPVSDPEGRVIGSISCVRPVAALDPGRRAREGEAMMQTAAAISQGMVDALSKPVRGRPVARASVKARGGPPSRTAARPAA